MGDLPVPDPAADQPAAASVRLPESDTVFVRPYDGAGDRVAHVGVEPAALGEALRAGLEWLWSSGGTGRGP